jgi:hypothetical protein
MAYAVQFRGADTQRWIEEISSGNKPLSPPNEGWNGLTMAALAGTLYDMIALVEPDLMKSRIPKYLHGEHRGARIEKYMQEIMDAIQAHAMIVTEIRSRKHDPGYGAEVVGLVSSEVGGWKLR